MKTCPNCGAENLQTASSCRMCATPIESPQDLLGIRADTPLAEEIPSSNIISGQEPGNQHAPASNAGDPVICPMCQSLNEPDWMFCQDCGSNLRESQTSEPQASESKQSGARPPDAQAPKSQSSESRPSDIKPAVAPANKPPEPVSEPKLAEQKPPEPKPAVKKNEAVIEKTAPAEKSSASDPITRTRVSAPNRVQTYTDPSTAIVCNSCGTVQVAEGAYCPHCGSTLYPSSQRREQQQDLPDEDAILELITDGGEVGESYTLEHRRTLIGRAEGQIVFPHDGYVSNRHASVIRRKGRYYLIDDNSRNGTFIRIDREVELKPGDTFLIGKQVLRFNKKE